MPLSPLEEDPGFKVCQVVVFDDKLNQLIAGDEREEHAGEVIHDAVDQHSLEPIRKLL